MVLFGIALAVVSLTFTDYGVTWDEASHVRYGDGVYEYFASGFRDREAFRYLDLYYYGAAFDLLCAVGKRLLPLDVYDSRHLLNALVALAGALGCWFLAREIGTARTAFLATLLLLLTPRFWGHGFNNPKDIPFAADSSLENDAWVFVRRRNSRLRFSRALVVRIDFHMALGNS